VVTRVAVLSLHTSWDPGGDRPAGRSARPPDGGLLTMLAAGVEPLRGRLRRLLIRGGPGRRATAAAAMPRQVESGAGAAGPFGWDAALLRPRRCCGPGAARESAMV
jgi:hypothetical protein